MSHDLGTCQQCQTRPARGYLSIHNAYGHHVGCWPTCLHCAEQDAISYTEQGYLVAFIGAASSSPARP